MSGHPAAAGEPVPAQNADRAGVVPARRGDRAHNSGHLANQYHRLRAERTPRLVILALRHRPVCHRRPALAGQSRGGRSHLRPVQPHPDPGCDRRRGLRHRRTDPRVGRSLPVGHSLPGAGHRPLSALFAYGAALRIEPVNMLRRTRAELARAAVATAEISDNGRGQASVCRLWAGRPGRARPQSGWRACYRDSRTTRISAARGRAAIPAGLTIGR